MSSPAGAVWVVGSINEDMVLGVTTLPAPGATVVAGSAARHPGGKGANQAVAAALAGARVRLIGRVGDDDAGRRALSGLTAADVDVSGVAVTTSPTGLAIVAVDAAGENLILVASGANAELRPPDIMAVSFPAGCLVVTQGELPADTLTALARQTAAAGARFMLNLAPVAALADEVIARADPLVVNESEAAELLAGSVPVATGAELAHALHRRFGSPAVVTLGAAGAALAENGEHVLAIPAPSAGAVVDTTGAGDAFTGTLAAFLAAGSTLPDAVRAAVCAGALAVTSAGAQGSYHRLDDILGLMRRAGLGGSLRQTPRPHAGMCSPAVTGPRLGRPAAFRPIAGSRRRRRWLAGRRGTGRPMPLNQQKKQREEDEDSESDKNERPQRGR